LIAGLDEEFYLNRLCSDTHLKPMKARSLYSILAVTLFASLLPACKGKLTEKEEANPLSIDKTLPASAGSRKVVFLPYWIASAQFAGYYVAKEMGIYQKFGIDLEIIPYEPFYTTDELIKTGKADFAALWLINAIEVKASGVDIVNIAQFSTRSSLMLVTKKTSGISKLEDMNHKKAGIWSGYELQPKALFKKYNLDVEIIPIGSTNNLFLKDGVEITNANWFDEYHSIINAGLDPEELNTFFFADYGLNFLEDGIYCLSDKMKQDPKLCTDFVEATIEGWSLAYADPEKTLDIVVAYAQQSKIPVNRIHQRWMLDRYKDLYYSEGKNTTVLAEKDYILACSVLKESGLISEVPAFGSFYQHYHSTEGNQ
jgi:NitT/TauT family transport system substrate-binding protein